MKPSRKRIIDMITQCAQHQDPEIPPESLPAPTECVAWTLDFLPPEEMGNGEQLEPEQPSPYLGDCPF